MATERGSQLGRESPGRQNRSDPSGPSGLEVDHAVADINRARARQAQVRDRGQQRIGRRLRWGHVLVPDHHIEVRAQADRLQLGLDQRPTLARDHAQRHTGTLQLAYQGGDPTKDAGMAERGIHRPIGGDQLFPHLRSHKLHLLGQRQPSASPEKFSRRIVEAMRPHHVGKGLFDQRIAVNEGTVEVEHQAAVVTIGARRHGSK